MLLRLGTRGSDLALWQTRWVIGALEKRYPGLEVEEVIFQTHGDQRRDAALHSPDLPAGSFVTTLEESMLRDEIDLAVHSCKDLPSQLPEELTIAAFPDRTVAHDVLLTREAVDLERLPAGFRVGTSSPRRSAQFLRYCPGVELVAIRGNVPTRVSKLTTGEYDGVILAAAGLPRLDLNAPHTVTLPTDRFVPAPAQGALAIETQRDSEAAEIVGAIDDASIRRMVEAERAVLRAVAATCQTPVGALATIEGDGVSLHGQLFTDDLVHFAEGCLTGDDPIAVGSELGATLRAQLERAACGSG